MKFRFIFQRIKRKGSVTLSPTNSTNLSLKKEAGTLLKKLKITLMGSLTLLWFIHALVDTYLFHQGDFSKTIFTLNFHEFWMYLIIILFFAIIYAFSSFIIKKQIELDNIIKTSEERYLRLLESSNDLFSSIQDGIAILDKEFNIIHINPTLKRWYLYKKPIVGKKCYELYCNQKKVCNDCPNLGFINQKEIISKVYPKSDAKGNGIGWIEVFSFPLFDQKSSDIIGIIHYLKDITEKIEAEQLIIEENKKLSELNKFRKNIITRVSHELKTPLNSIQSATQHLLTSYRNEISPETLQFIDIIYKGGVRLTKLVENILDIAKLESGRLFLNKERTNFIEIIKNCIDEVSFFAIKRNILLKSYLDQEIYLNIDPIRIEQLIINLLSNAIKNTPSGGEVIIKTLENNNHVDLQIKDTGIGILKEEEETLFQKFGKIERFGKNLGIDNEGIGLGLYISREIVQLHDGQIIVDSKGRDQGSTFTIRLALD